VSDVVKAATAATQAVAVTVKGFWANLSHVFKNTLGQVSADEVLKVLAGVLGGILLYFYFFTHAIEADKGNYVMNAVLVLWGYAFATGTVGYVKGM